MTGGAVVSLGEWFWWLLSLLPRGDEVVDILRHGDTWDKAKIIAGLAVALIVAFGGAAEIVIRIWKWRFRRTHRLLEELEAAEKRVTDMGEEIRGLRAGNQRLERRLAEEIVKHPEAAVARAERELRDRNETTAIHHLEEWFELNAVSIRSIALRLARYRWRSFIRRWPGLLRTYWIVSITFWPKPGPMCRTGIGTLCLRDICAPLCSRTSAGPPRR